MVVESKEKVAIGSLTTKQRLEVFNTASEVQYTHRPTVIHFSGWPENVGKVTADMYEMMLFMENVRKEVGTERETVKMMVYDAISGIDGAACFIALYELFWLADGFYRKIGIFTQ